MILWRYNIIRQKVQDSEIKKIAFINIYDRTENIRNSYLFRITNIRSAAVTTLS